MVSKKKQILVDGADKRLENSESEVSIIPANLVGHLDRRP